MLRHREGGRSVKALGPAADGKTSADDGRVHKYGRGSAYVRRSLVLKHLRGWESYLRMSCNTDE